MKILVLGGSGVLGRALITRLATLECDIHAVVRSAASADRVRSAAPRAVPMDAQDVAGGCYDRVFNMVVDYGRETSLSDLIHANLLYPLRIVEAVSAAAVINISSALPAEYSDYAWSKKMLERSLDRLARQRRHRNVNVQLHNVYGPDSRPTNFVAALIHQMSLSAPVQLSSAGNSRDFIHLDDVVEALTCLSDRLEVVSSAPTLAIGTGYATPLRELVDLVRAKLGSASPVQYGARPDNPFEPPVMRADLAGMAATGWTPAWSLDRGIDHTIACQMLAARASKAGRAGHRSAVPASGLERSTAGI